MSCLSLDGIDRHEVRPALSLVKRNRDAVRQALSLVERETWILRI